ncbi:hypothetical protein WOLCODRAFT_148027 [Wolfiporia cocos MD-104 SS10]|uniref:Uncharacterized protein n=1 Tax=Wolfiporia cocos (strain MD-104) TaxID=742152 RepID=A0A2H3IW47_WOLCO|nr:hypothetical protein WOLCODRAFT_148027 [Wolfiporia cocos MD-104 SS10]
MPSSFLWVRVIIRYTLEYITSHLHTHQKSMKVQTSKGNYLTNLAVRTELVDFDGDEGSWERNMDDLILRAAILPDSYWLRSYWDAGIPALFIQDFYESEINSAAETLQVRRDIIYLGRRTLAR